MLKNEAYHLARPFNSEGNSVLTWEFALALMRHHNWKDIEMISAELNRLVHLLNDMEEQNLGLPERAINFDVVLLSCEVVTLARQWIAKTIRLEVKASQSFMVCLPENMLRQVLLNLLLNAAQAMNSRSFGHICIKLDKNQSGLVIQILDDGMGFSQDMLDSSTFSSSISQSTGVGSGLAMVQRFVKNNGGSFKLNNRLPHGACVTIFLPCVSI